MRINDFTRDPFFAGPLRGNLWSINKIFNKVPFYWCYRPSVIRVPLAVVVRSLFPSGVFATYLLPQWGFIVDETLFSNNADNAVKWWLF